MFQEERQRKIYDIVCSRKSVKVSELSHLLGISEVTVRRDLDELHQQELLLRTHGGAIAMYSVGSVSSAPELIQNHKQLSEKQAIAACAYTFIKDKDTIFTDGSSTVYELMKLVATGSKKQLLIITTSLLIVNVLAECGNATVMMLGGEVNYNHNNVQGHITNLQIRSLRADKCFIGINGIDEKFGYSTATFPEAEQKTQMLLSSLQSFVLADSTKFGKTYLAKVDADCDFLITDENQTGYDYSWLEDKCNVLFSKIENKESK